MISKPFISTHLLIDWRWGEAYFAHKLLDYELSSNNGNWQWVAGTGCVAAPYFRIFNPKIQQKRFDPKNEYVRKWVGKINPDTAGVGLSRTIFPIKHEVDRVRIFSEKNNLTLRDKSVFS